MDKFKALELEKEIKGITLNGYSVIEFINNGKSAAVFKAEKDGNNYALKIFDNELIERFGHEIQIKRIEQEILLKGHEINNLVKIFEGGKGSFSGQDYYYLVMEYIEGKNLKEYIQSESYNIEFVSSVLNKLINTTEQLLNLKQIAHRDIKPENIMVKTDGSIVLMDLGVLKLIGAKSFSDEEEKSFVGTLRYAAPEFLLRTEEDSIDGWRALNIYQIGATLHDLIVKKELFWDKTPYANLVIAIKDDIPPITNKEYPFEILQLTRDMMTKDWRKRLVLVTLKRINDTISSSLKPAENFLESSVDEILKMRMGHQAKFDELEKLQRTKEELRNKQKEIAKRLTIEIDKCFEFLKNKRICNAVKKSKNFYFDKDRQNTNLLTQNYLYEIEGELKMGFIRNLFVLVRMSNDESNFTEIDIWAIFPSIFNKAKIENPIDLFQSLAKEHQSQNRYNQVGNFQTLKTISIFSGIIDFDDSLNTHLTNQIIKLVLKALKSVENDVTKKIEWYEKLAKSNKAVNFSGETSDHRNIIIDRL